MVDTTRSLPLSVRKLNPDSALSAVPKVLIVHEVLCIAQADDCSACT